MVVVVCVSVLWLYECVSVRKVGGHTLGSSKDSTLRVSLKTNPEPAICPINLDSAAMAGGTIEGVAIGVWRRIVHAAVMMAPWTNRLLFQGHVASFIVSTGGTDGERGGTWWKLKDSEEDANETKRRRNDWTYVIVVVPSKLQTVCVLGFRKDRMDLYPGSWMASIVLYWSTWYVPIVLVSYVVLYFFHTSCTELYYSLTVLQSMTI